MGMGCDDVTKFIWEIANSVHMGATLTMIRPGLLYEWSWTVSLDVKEIFEDVVSLLHCCSTKIYSKHKDEVIKEVI